MDTIAPNQSHVNPPHASAKILLAFFMCFALLSVSRAQASAGGFNGRWDLTVHDAAGDYPSWIEVNASAPHVSVTFVGKIGHARHLAVATLTGHTLRFTVPADGLADGTEEYSAVLRSGRLTGQMREAGHRVVAWDGEPAPLLTRNSGPRWGKPERLFNGQTLQGWHLTSTGVGGWTVDDGAIVTRGGGGDLVSDGIYGDFQLHMEWRCGPGANSGVYLRGRYEVQIEVDSAAEPPSHHTGGVYGFLAPRPEQPRTPDIWQTFDLTLVGRTVTIVQNGVTVVDHRPIPGITGGALDSHEGAFGPIVLQGGETGTTRFRNLQIRPATSE